MIKNRKQITFDLSDENLKQYYPKPSHTHNPKYHNKAWKDIANFMSNNGFEHRQRSVYASYNPMTNAEVLALIDSMVEKMPWLDKCLNAIDITDIGKQHSLMQVIHRATIKLEPMDDKNNF
jgi:virulence-associated protein VapD